MPKLPGPWGPVPAFLDRWPFLGISCPDIPGFDLSCALYTGIDDLENVPGFLFVARLLLKLDCVLRALLAG